MEGGRGATEGILIKRLLSWKLEYYCESRRPKFYAAAPPTDVILQVIRA